ncbi:iron-sulfur cluster assembly protein [Lacibacter cauensis]|uniref:Iron-sulfur cluster assembly protein n=1 Tax=Lacibacter cauensis TaxID=510947 RepID=A0A562SWD7_9BACT|nr:iron-sulfur cluster assembly accessory protein [Lacibacter cauensis]TWI85348.1 iron-sulfur cluster assembly protein [Lacibacter cauensis]
METINQAPVTFTASAIEELQRLYTQQAEGKYLRVGVKGGGCSGLSYVLEFDEKKDNDELYVIEGISCIMEKSHGMYLFGMEINWDNGLNNRGFTFTNPNASKTCGCGTSFAV